MSGSAKQTTNSTQETSPWAPQASALSGAFSNAQTAYGQASQAQAPTDFTAQMTPEQMNTFRQMISYGSDPTNANSNAAAGSTLTNAGVNGATGALSGLSGFDPSATNNTDAVLAAANKYANNPAIDGMVQAAMRDANQQVHDVALPGIESNAANSGNINSSRTGVAQGMVERALAQKTADVSANMRGAAFNDGLSLAQNQLAGNNAASLSAMQSAGSLGDSLSRAGMTANSQAIQDRAGLFDIANAGGAGLQGNNQLGLDNQQQRYQSQVTSPYDALNGLMQIIGGQSWGGTTTGQSTVKSTPSAWQVAGGLMSSAGSLAKGFGLGF